MKYSYYYVSFDMMSVSSRSKLGSIGSNKGGKNDAIGVFIRFRPLNQVERSKNMKYSSRFEMINDNSVKIPNGGNQMTFDHIFNTDASQNTVYSMLANPIMESVLEGYNGTIFAYGQTGSGR